MSVWILTDNGMWLNVDKVMYFSIQNTSVPCGNITKEFWAVIANFPFVEDNGEGEQERAWMFVREFTTKEDAKFWLQNMLADC